MKTDIEKYEDVKTRNIYEEKSNNLSLKKDYTPGCRANGYVHQNV